MNIWKNCLIQPRLKIPFCLKTICDKKGIDFGNLDSFDFTDYKNRQYDALADIIREGLDMELIYRILNREV